MCSTCSFTTETSGDAGGGGHAPDLGQDSQPKWVDLQIRLDDDDHGAISMEMNRLSPRLALRRSVGGPASPPLTERPTAHFVTSSQSRSLIEGSKFAKEPPAKLSPFAQQISRPAGRRSESLNESWNLSRLVILAPLEPGGTSSTGSETPTPAQVESIGESIQNLNSDSSFGSIRSVTSLATPNFAFDDTARSRFASFRDPSEKSAPPAATRREASSRKPFILSNRFFVPSSRLCACLFVCFRLLYVRVVYSNVCLCSFR